VPLLEEAVRLARGNDKSALAYASQFLGRGVWLLGDAERGLALTEEALASHRSAKSWQGMVLALVQLGWMRTLSGNPGESRDPLQECVDICVAHGERWICSYALWALGLAAWLEGGLEEAALLESEALRLKRDVRDQAGARLCIEVLAWIAVSQQHAQHGAVLLGAAASAWQTLPGFLPQPLQELHIACHDNALRVLGSSRFDAAFVSGNRMTTDQAAALALDEHDDRAHGSSARTQHSPTELTRREQEIAALLAEGRSNADIGRTLVVSTRTAETHVRHIMDKLGFSTRAQIAGWAAGGGSVDEAT
jgi:DNA-binding CsgD family transcriptional regulator